MDYVPIIAAPSVDPFFHNSKNRRLKSRDAIKLHQEKYNANSVIPHNVLASDHLTDCHQALFFQQDTLV